MSDSTRDFLVTIMAIVCSSIITSSWQQRAQTHSTRGRQGTGVISSQINIPSGAAPGPAGPSSRVPRSEHTSPSPLTASSTNHPGLSVTAPAVLSQSESPPANAADATGGANHSAVVDTSTVITIGDGRTPSPTGLGARASVAPNPLGEVREQKAPDTEEPKAPLAAKEAGYSPTDIPSANGGDGSIDQPHGQTDARHNGQTHHDRPPLIAKLPIPTASASHQSRAASLRASVLASSSPRTEVDQKAPGSDNVIYSLFAWVDLSNHEEAAMSRWHFTVLTASMILLQLLLVFLKDYWAHALSNLVVLSFVMLVYTVRVGSVVFKLLQLQKGLPVADQSKNQ